MSVSDTIYTVKNILILDDEGKRIAARYYTSEFPTLEEQRAFEVRLFEKTRRNRSEIVMLDNSVIVYRIKMDCFLYVSGSSDENELILYSVLACLHESISQLLRHAVEKHSLLENLDYVLLAIDEIVDRGIILDADWESITGKVAMKGAEAEVPIGEQTISQALKIARDQFLTLAN
mmetsp:Transcript_4038/g.12306  ORF Transcript_4038/g.12306 Transcript_4038/m.12306 type:complete len:176 (+) Transcript_4038:119-646(+)